MKYSKEKIVKALLLAPLPLLFFAALLFIIMNREYSLYSIFLVFAGHGLVYLAYCILAVPFNGVTQEKFRKSGGKCIPIHGLFLWLSFLAYVIGCF